MIALYSCGKLLIDALIFFYTSILKLQFLLEKIIIVENIHDIDILVNKILN